MQRDTKKEIGIVYKRSFGIVYIYRVVNSIKLTCITEVTLAIFMKKITDTIENSIKKSELNSEIKLLKR